MAQEFGPQEQVVAPSTERKILRGIFAGLNLLHDLEEEKRIERKRDIR
jgi:hypothetical protein